MNGLYESLRNLQKNMINQEYFNDHRFKNVVDLIEALEKKIQKLKD